jgi:hypothetical protein
MTNKQAAQLANKIENDPRGFGRYEAHGLSQDDKCSWFVCVSDTIATPGFKYGRQLDVRSADEWNEIVTG